MFCNDVADWVHAIIATMGIFFVIVILLDLVVLIHLSHMVKYATTKKKIVTRCVHFGTQGWPEMEQRTDGEMTAL